MYKILPPPPKKSKILKRRGREGKRKGKEKGKEKGGKREGENKCYVWEGRKHHLYKSKMYVSSAAKILTKLVRLIQKIWRCVTSKSTQP